MRLQISTLVESEHIANYAALNWEVLVSCEKLSIPTPMNCYIQLY